MKRSLLAYDLFGAAAAIAVGTVGLWSGLVRPQTSSQQLNDLQTRLAEARTSYETTLTAIERKSIELNRLRTKVQENGSLPQRSPVEADLRRLSQLAVDNHVQLVEIAPLATEQYPGLTELTYSAHASGTFGGLMAFMRDFERAPFWADISRVRLSRKGSLDDPHRSAEIVVSLFASQNGDEPRSP